MLIDAYGGGGSAVFGGMKENGQNNFDLFVYHFSLF